MVIAIGSADDEGAAFAICECGAQGFLPKMRFDRGGFVDDEKIEAGAAEIDGFEAGFYEDRGARSR